VENRNAKPIIVSGRILKSINRQWNKRRAKLYSIKDKQILDLEELLDQSQDENQRLIYLQKSYDVFGNDGKHLNKSINEPENRIVSKYIADALYKASDHLPVIIDLVLQDESK